MDVPFKPFDALVLTVIILISAIIQWLRTRKDSTELPPKRDPPSIDPKFKFITKSFLRDRAVQGLKMVVFYGSQSGTAEGFARLLALESQIYNIRGMVADPEECEIEELMRLERNSENEIVENYLFVFCLASYGEGDPTDNAKEFYDWVMTKKNLNLSGLKYAVFGCGNKVYPQFNKVAIDVDRRLEEIGGKRIHQVGKGDADENIDDHFNDWKENFWRRVCESFEIEGNTDGDLPRNYELEIHDGVEPRVPYQSNDQNQRYSAKNPFLAPILVNRELHKAGDRSCMHIEFDITGSNLRYEAGDHVGVYAENDSDLVTRLGELCRMSSDDSQPANLETVFSLTNHDADDGEKNPFPCPTTYRLALTHYIDITDRPRMHVLKELIRYCSDDKDKEFLRLICSTTPEGKAKYMSRIKDACRNIVHVLEDIPSCHPPIDHICELLPRLQPRYYSISSSGKVHPKTVHITAVLTKYRTPTGRINNGVATTFLSLKKPKAQQNLPKVPIFIRRSQFRLPILEGRPIIMVGPGTGLAPFRGFIQERDRDFQEKKLAGKDAEKIVGKTVLFFGCRKRSEDFLYEEELNQYKASGSLEFHVAFSRDQDSKFYVTDLLRANAANVWNLIKKESKGYFYVCGDAKSMAPQVKQILIEIIETGGMMTRAEAEDYLKTMQKQGRYSTDVWS